MRGMWLTLIVLATSGPVARADWWRAYEADGVYPEDEDWLRIMMGGGAVRSFEDGALVLDSRASSGIVDSYYQYMPSLPEPGQEFFLAQWRLRILGTSGRGAVGLWISFGPPGDVFLEYELNRIYSANEFEHVADFEPGVFHEYALTTSDLATYALYVDGVLVHVGLLNAPGFGAWLQWGDASSSFTSLSDWDWVRFGVLAAPLTGDVNCDGAVNFGDINPFVRALSDPEGYQNAYPNCWPSNADINGDGSVNFGDINPFVDLLMS